MTKSLNESDFDSKTNESKLDISLMRKSLDNAEKYLQKMKNRVSYLTKKD